MAVRVILALVVMLLSSLVLAQPKASINTEHECAGIGGRWQLHPDKWSRFCVIPASDEAECKDKGGGWGLSNIVPGEGLQMRCLSSPSIEGMIKQCIAAGGSWGKHGARKEHCYFEARKQECLDKGGEWKPLGLRRIAGCVEKAADAGKPCRDGSECQFGQCIGPNSAKYDEPVDGTCRATSDVFGCYTLVRAGKSMGRMCVD